MSYICNPVDLWNYLGCLRALDHGISLWLVIEIFWMVGIILMKLANQPNISTSLKIMNYLIGTLMTRTFLWRNVYIDLNTVLKMLWLCLILFSLSFNKIWLFLWYYPNYVMHTISQYVNDSSGGKNRISNGKKPALVTKPESIPVLYSSLIISLKLILTKNIYLLPCYCRIYF